MNRKLDIDAQALMREVARYLAAVDVFRQERCEPTWLPELAPSGRAGPLTQGHPSARRAPRASRG
jgi:hypothetical protein